MFKLEGCISESKLIQKMFQDSFEIDKEDYEDDHYTRFNRYVGGVHAMTPAGVLISTSDAWKNRVNGLPINSLLIEPSIRATIQIHIKLTKFIFSWSKVTLTSLRILRSWFEPGASATFKTTWFTRISESFARFSLKHNTL